nr:2-C-methyl-D-erythritol 4-phosphate cytidylyltransferase [Amycolatopsis nigrescens]
MLAPVHGEPLLTHAVRGLFDSRSVDLVIVTAPARHVASYRSALRALPGAETRVRVLPGGADRAESTRLAFAAVEPGTYQIVLLHDAARAFTPPATIRAVVSAVAEGAGAVVPVLPVTDTVKLVNADDVVTGTQDRARLRTVQSPQGFTEEVFRDVCGADPVSKLGDAVHTVAGHPNALRVATPFDLAVAEAMLVRDLDQRGKS